MIWIFSEDILVVDRSINPISKHVIVAILEGEMVVRKLLKKDNAMYLTKGKDFSNALKITYDLDFEIWGVVSHAIHKYI